MVEPRLLTESTTFSAVRQREWPQVPYASSMVDDDDYSHFPVMAAGFDVLGILYHHGRNHGQSDTEAICLSQTPAAGGNQNLTINGNEASGGVVRAGGATQVTVTSTANDSARTFSVTGTLAGVPVVRSGVGPASAGTVTLSGNIDPGSITQVSVTGNTVGAITVGLLRIPSDIAYKWSENGGATWSSRIVLGDGMTGGQTRFYYPALGRRRDSSLIAIMGAVDVTTGVMTKYTRTSFDGRENWTALREMVITGPAASANTLAWYGKIHTLPSGCLVASCYSGDDNFTLVSDDWTGDSWTSYLIVNSSSPGYSEQAIAIVDEDNWIAVLRVDGVTSGMRQFKTTDRGVTWTAQGETNLPASGGYASHELNVLDVDGIRYVFLSYMARDVGGVDPPTVDAICGRRAKAADVLAASTNWGAEVTLQASLALRSGYPSLFVNPDTGTALMAYGKETATRFAEVHTIKIDIVGLIRTPITDLVTEASDPDSWTPVLTCQTPGNLAVTYTTQIGRVLRIGKLRVCTYEIIANATWTSASGQVRITGLPDASATEARVISAPPEFRGITKADYTQINAQIGANSTQITFRCSGSGQLSADLVIADMPSGNDKRLVGTVIYTARD